MSNRSVRWSVCVALAGAAGVLGVQAAEPANDELDTVLITAQRAERDSSGATGLDLDVKETPQSISIVTRELMTDFGTNNLNDALRLATGINVEEWETNRTNYMARGFEIKNTQTDGVGLPNNWGIVTGTVDSYAYEKLEVIRGANGLLTGVGNASGTINFVRKRPTNETQGEIGVTVGSWDGKRVETDYSTPLTSDGAWAGRFVAVYDDRDSYLRSLHNERLYLYGVVDGQLGDRTTVTVGYALQNADTTGNMWGALVLSNDDGTQAEFARDSSTTQDWTYWNTRYRNAFLELNYALGENWNLKGSYNYRTGSEDDRLFYAYTYVGLDPSTAVGLYGWPGAYAGQDEAHLGDLQLSGKFSAWGRDHELMLGIAQATSSANLDMFPVDPADPANGALPAFPYAGDALPEPVWGPRTEYDHNGQMMRRAWGATRLAVTDRFKVIAGFNLAEYSRQGVDSFGVYFEQEESKFSPYGGVTFDITDHLLAYASYSDIYQPQDQYDINERYLAPSKGENLEAGVKADWLDNRLLTTLAWFKARQNGLSTFAGINGNGNYYYEGVDVDSQGVEFEAVGRLGAYAELVFGFTTVKLEGQDGEDIYEWVPRRTANLSLSSRIPNLPRLRLGLNGRWQSGISTVDSTTNVTIRQDSYATLNLFGEWKAGEHVAVRANVNNVTGEKYITSLYQVGYYSAPRNYSLNLNYRF